MVKVVVNAKTIREFLYSFRLTEQFLMEVFISLIGNFRSVFKLFKNRYILPVYYNFLYCELCKFYKVLFSEKKHKYKIFYNIDFCLPTFVFVLLRLPIQKTLTSKTVATSLTSMSSLFCEFLKVFTEIPFEIQMRWIKDSLLKPLVFWETGYQEVVASSVISVEHSTFPSSRNIW